MKKTIALILALMMCLALLCSCDSSSSSKTYSATCKVCGRTFSYEDVNYGNQAQKNVSNISRTNMCLNCYSNYKYLNGY